MKTYMVNEVDCWHNKEEGYFINDVMRNCARIELEDPYSVREVLKKLREYYNLPTGRYTTNIKELCEPTMFEVINRKTGEYVLQLELVRE